MLQELSEIPKAVELEYRIETDLSSTANANFHAAEILVPRRIKPAH